MRLILEINIGDTFGDFECIGIENKRTGSKQYTGNFYILKCKHCGRIKSLRSSTIRYNHGLSHKSCGKGLKTKDPIFYDRWQAMRTRTNNPNYPHADCYSERGIDSDEFKYFIDFYDAMYDSYKELADKIGASNTSLERIDVNKGYTRDNCIWIDKHEQQKNTRKSVKFEVTFPDGHREQHICLRDFAVKHGLDPSTCNDCMNPERSTKQHRGFKFKRLE